MRIPISLPKHPFFDSDDEYVASLLEFVSSCELFQKLCGGVHVLDFLTKEPDLYSTILSKEWISWFELHHISDILYLLMREDESVLEHLRLSYSKGDGTPLWRDQSTPPLSLLEYILTIRRHSLNRRFTSKHLVKDKGKAALPRHVAVGMKEKKIHEVHNFAKYIDNLSEYITISSPHKISHIIDFGSGQNYLGRALASPPYSKKVVALESKQLNIDGARKMDIHAKLAPKDKNICNKKQYRSKVNGSMAEKGSENSIDFVTTAFPALLSRSKPPQNQTAVVNESEPKITYLETMIQDGGLSHMIQSIPNNQSPSIFPNPQLMVISLHSCGNLLHHGVRSLVLNPEVKAIAMVGCCYNLVTERLGPPTYKLPSLRSSNLRLDTTSSACDPHGFPMSEKLATYQHAYGEGIRFNITARMMACQAPENWTDAESESFFTRHFYRALLQRIFLDRGVVSRPNEIDEAVEDGSPRGWTGTGPPIIIGSLRKGCYSSFKAYVRGALKKLSENTEFARIVEEHMHSVTDDELEEYEKTFYEKRKALSVLWSLMAFSAGVVESAIVVDRWRFLQEQDSLKECWVETVFEYGQSPRNLAVVAIKK